MNDAVDICKAILSGAYPDVMISNELPANHPRKPYVMISQTGGDEVDFISKPIMTLQCFDSTDDGARRLAQGCAHMLAEAALTHELMSSAKLINLMRDEYAPRGYGSYSAQIHLTINE